LSYNNSRLKTSNSQLFKWVANVRQGRFIIGIFKKLLSVIAPNKSLNCSQNSSGFLLDSYLLLNALLEKQAQKQ
jgi:hypothetical protein